jgi:hypothetical protein
MSPEQLLGKRLDCRSDIYSAGIVLYEMLVGQTPFSSETPMGWMNQHVDVLPKPPSTVAKGGKISPPLDRVVLRALAKAPADRPPSMEMFALELVAALNAPTEPPPPPWWRRALRASARSLVRFARFLVAVVLAFGARAWKIARVIGSGSWRTLRAIGSGSWRTLRAIGSGSRRIVHAIGSRSQKAPPAVRPVIQRPAPTPVYSGRIVGGGFVLRLSPGRRVLIALFVVLATAALLVALFPEVRSDFGLGGDDKPGVDKTTKRHHTPEHGSEHAPARERPRDKDR